MTVIPAADNMVSVLLRYRSHEHEATRNTQLKFSILAPLGVADLLAACSGGAGSNSSTIGVTSSAQRVSGSLRIVTGLGDQPATEANGASARRKPEHVSPATGNAALFIDGAAAAAGTTSSCTASAGTGTGCTIAWSANLTTPASHTFAVEIDTGTTGSPASTVLAEGRSSYALVAGANTLPAMVPWLGASPIRRSPPRHGQVEPIRSFTSPASRRAERRSPRIIRPEAQDRF